METCNSGTKGAVLHFKKHKRGLGPMETSYSDANHVVLYAPNDR